MTGHARSKPGTHTKDALLKKADAKAKHRAQLEQADALVASGVAGPDKAANMVEGCTAWQIRYAIKKALAPNPSRPAWAILTKVEMERLVQWVL
eukprot:4887215-Prymnesium_polylepis.1